MAKPTNSDPEDHSKPSVPGQQVHPGIRLNENNEPFFWVDEDVYLQVVKHLLSKDIKTINNSTGIDGVELGAKTSLELLKEAMQDFSSIFIHNDFLIHGTGKILDEFAEELSCAGLEQERCAVAANSIDAGGAGSAISLAQAALSCGGLALLTRIIVVYLKKNQGQRKLVFQFSANGKLNRVEVESPDPKEIDKWLSKSQALFIVKNSESDRSSQSRRNRLRKKKP